MNIEELHKELLKHQPYEVMPIIFDYISGALISAPNKKVDELFIHFERGVRDAIEQRRFEE